MLVLSRKKDERVVITCGDTQIEVMVIEIRGDKVKIGFEAPRNVAIHRQEIQQAINAEATRKQFMRRK